MDSKQMSDLIVTRHGLTFLYLIPKPEHAITGIVNWGSKADTSKTENAKIRRLDFCMRKDEHLF